MPSSNARSSIVVGIDYSQASSQALEAAIRAAKEWNARLELVHVTSPLGAPGLDLQHPAFDPARNETADVTASLPEDPDDWVARAEAAGVPARFVTRAGPAASVLIEEAERVGARAICVGTHGRTGLRRAVLGSVAQRVLARSPVPVLMVPDGSIPAA